MKREEIVDILRLAYDSERETSYWKRLEGDYELAKICLFLADIYTNSASQVEQMQCETCANADDIKHIEKDKEMWCYKYHAFFPYKGGCFQHEPRVKSETQMHVS